MTQSTSPWRRPGARRIIAVAGVSAVVLAAAIGPSSASGSTSVSVTVATSVNGVVGAPAFTGEAGTVGITLTNQSLKNLAGYAIVVPKGIGTVANQGVSDANWNQTKVGCGFLSNCSALYLVTPKALSYVLSKDKSITSSFGVTAPAPGTAQFRVLGVGSNYSGLVVVGSQPTLTIVDGAATELQVSVSPPVVMGEPNTVTVRSVREYPEGVFTNKVFPGPLTLSATSGGIIYTAPDVTGEVQVEVDVTFDMVQVEPLQTLTANSGSITGSASFEVVAAGLVFESENAAVVKLTGAGGTTYTANLRNGATGPVSFTEVPCSALLGEPSCDTEVNLNGNFKSPSGAALYSNEAPAQIDWTCPATECKFIEPENSYGDNVQEQWVDFENYTIEVSLREDGGGYTEFAPASFCNKKEGNPADGERDRITDPEAKAAGFCVDVYNITREGGSFEGDLTIPVLFVEDPKLRGI